MTTLRKIFFWLHLACGLIAGVVIAIMSATGVATAFERERLGWLDRDGTLHVNPYTGTAAAHRMIEEPIAWHCWLGAKDGPTSTARLATTASLVLVRTGFALSWDRFFRRQTATPAAGR